MHLNDDSVALMESSRRRICDEFDENQARSFTKWINSRYKKVGLKVDNVFEDFRTGVKLVSLVEHLTGDKLPCERGRLRIHHMVNVQTAIHHVHYVKKVNLHGISVEAIVDGCQTQTLGLLWTLICNHRVLGKTIVSPTHVPQSKEEWPVTMINDKLQLLHGASKGSDIGQQAVNSRTLGVIIDKFARKQSATNANIHVPIPVSECEFSMKLQSDPMRQGHPRLLTKDNDCGSISNGDSRGVLKNANLAVTKMELSLSLLDDVLESPMSSFDCWNKLDCPLNGAAQRASPHAIMCLLREALNGAQEDMCLLKSYCGELKQVEQDNCSKRLPN